MGDVTFADLESEAGVEPRRSRKPSCPPSRIKRYEREAAVMAKTGEWAGAGGGHLVALYDMLHEVVYGVRAGELTPDAYAQALRAADKLLAASFAGDVDAAVGFLEWCWRREQQRHRWRQREGRDLTRIGWRLQFGQALVTDWKVNRHKAV